MSRALAALALLAVFIAPVMAPIAFAAEKPVTITIGALLPLTGDLSDYGARQKATLEVAIQDMNKYLEEHHAWFRLALAVEDTATQPDQAVQKFNALVARGIKFIIGPMSSAEAKKVKDLATQQNVLLISPSSTADELAIPGDNLYRFCSPNAVEAEALVKLMQDLGIKGIVLIVRADTWGEDLKKAIIENAEKAGIEYKPALEYNPESPNFGAIAAQAKTYVDDLAKKYGKPHVAVVVLAFKEAVQLMTEAANYKTLRDVLWIGSDATAKLASISQDPVVRQFAKETLFINPLYSPAATENQKKIAEKVKAMIGDVPDAYSYAGYDAVVAIALALMKAPPDIRNNPDKLVDFVKKQLDNGLTMSDEFAKLSATGKFPLSKAGDRATADFDWWIVYDFNGKWDWYLVGKYLGLQRVNKWYKVNGVTYPELVKQKFGGAAAATTTQAPQTTTTTTQQQTTTQPATQAPATTQQTTTTKKGGSNTGLIVGSIIVIIIVIIGAALALRKK